MSDTIRINGNAHSWGSITAKVAGQKFVGFTKIEFGDKRKRGKKWGMGKDHAPRARSRGRYEPDPVKLTGPKGTVEALRAQLAALSASGTSYGDASFLITVQFVEAGDVPILVEIEDCVVDEDASSHEENPDPLEDTLSLDCMRIRRNGRTLHS